MSFTSEPPPFDSAGVPRAPCSGRLMGGETCVCGHNPALHDERLVCHVCHEVCDYCGQFRDQHSDNEWRSCVIDAERAGQQADALDWWKSQQ